MSDIPNLQKTEIDNTRKELTPSLDPQRTTDFVRNESEEAKDPSKPTAVLGLTRRPARRGRGEVELREPSPDGRIAREEKREKPATLGSQETRPEQGN